MRITKNSITSNTGVGYAGGIHLGDVITGSSATIMNNVITGNTAPGTKGAGVFARQSTITLSGNKILGNTGSDGAGIYLDQSQGSVTGNHISVNVATGDARGGGVFANNGTITISRNIIYDNQAQQAAGVYGYGSGVTVAGNSIAGNSGNLWAGVQAYNNASFSGNSIVGNVAAGWGTVETHGSGAITCNTVVGNTASAGGAGVYVYTPPASLANNNLNGNTSYELYNNSASNVTGANNWWGTTTPSVIDSEIYDFFDNAAKGVVNYSPFLTGPALCAPPAPPTGLTAGAAPAVASGVALNLSWNANAEGDIGGYKVLLGHQRRLPLRQRGGCGQRHQPHAERANHRHDLLPGRGGVRERQRRQRG